MAGLTVATLIAVKTIPWKSMISTAIQGTASLWHEESCDSISSVKRPSKRIRHSNDCEHTADHAAAMGPEVKCRKWWPLFRWDGRQRTCTGFTTSERRHHTAVSCIKSENRIIRRASLATDRITAIVTARDPKHDHRKCDLQQSFHLFSIRRKG